MMLVAYSYTCLSPLSPSLTINVFRTRLALFVTNPEPDYCVYFNFEVTCIVHVCVCEWVSECVCVCVVTLKLLCTFLAGLDRKKFIFPLLFSLSLSLSFPLSLSLSLFHNGIHNMHIFL